jgi:uncharacterized phosphatase
MQHLFFVRHGESELNLKRTYAGQTDTPLTDLGRQQAKIAGDQAKLIKIDLIICSPLSRAHDTAQIIANEIGYPTERILINPLFIERSLGSLEGHSWDEVGEDVAKFPDIETEEQLLVRARAGLEYLHKLPEANILLVGHGSYSRSLRYAIDPSQVYDEPPNAEIVQLV